MMFGAAAAIIVAFVAHGHEHSYQQIYKHESSRRALNAPALTALDMTSLLDHDHDPDVIENEGSGPKSAEGQGQSLAIPKRIILALFGPRFGRRGLPVDQKIEGDTCKSKVVPSPQFKFRRGYSQSYDWLEKRGVLMTDMDLKDQAFLFKVESRDGKVLDWEDYLDISTEFGHGSCGSVIDGNALILCADGEGRLEFTVRAARKIRKGWNIGIYPIRGKMMDLAQRSCGAGVPGDIFGYQSTHDDGDLPHGPTYWEKKEDAKIRRGSEMCTIIANEIPPDEWYSERGLLEYYLGLEWDHGD
uniref:Uncharacterized protein n=1 Tax=Minutocellus polymorphus TaxID=265543 RepID=A0A7S0AMF9_9STRA|mmetsp:Transcript_16833/g.28032  ORF Transcript_16833/g.28032 Transcript_16833/m.28032 type:complete len:301 (+) Transcript_16833:287-1189(+)